MLTSPLMQRALVAAVLVGATAPVVGTFLVQRRLALLGDGIGHIALTGVATGWLVGALVGLTPADALALPGAMLVAVLGAVGIEWVRARGRITGDVAMAILFYGGIAGGVLLIKVAGGTSANLMSYLFGSIATVSTTDVGWTVALAGLVLAVGLGLRGALFAVSHDEEFARASGLPVGLLTSVLAALAALTVTVAMRVVGLLLVSALMIVPVATAQVVARSFARTMALASAIGAAVSVVGLVVTYWQDLPPGAVIVVLAIVVYAVTTAVQHRRHRPDPTVDPHPDLDDDVRVEQEA
ncbi:metal ABC transporter permease [Isoptericola sp. b441]|uniref:Metal ABC transporter permease n=1 Tax=Actinotalea lenta TaxID=3064654 RepID=A0ABT9DD16_9CELL|nr:MULTISPECIES: metal ABC transporter permease [unclassified Isoptericola]MDO8108098.1 metal ABC transporter permease [Isoptericola sp. b441]MDO8120233.1 metal ABC transporter permease [Isoptericola sp. b490]